MRSCNQCIKGLLVEHVQWPDLLFKSFEVCFLVGQSIHLQVIGGLNLQTEPDVEIAVVFQGRQAFACVRIVLVEGCQELLLADGFATIGKQHLCLQCNTKCHDDCKRQKYFFHLQLWCLC